MKKKFDTTEIVSELQGSVFFLPPQQTTPVSEEKSLKARKDESPKGRMEEIRQSGKPENLLSGNPAIPNARKPENRKVPKYSTQLEEDLQIQVSIFAKMHRMKDYEVVQDAIEEYLKNHP